MTDLRLALGIRAEQLKLGPFEGLDAPGLVNGFDSQLGSVIHLLTVSSRGATEGMQGPNLDRRARLCAGRATYGAHGTRWSGPPTTRKHHRHSAGHGGQPAFPHVISWRVIVFR